jgi:CRISPR/Cas system CSM-associated protein Csm3 (group 7 of RAMP superfamily)
VVDVSIGKPAFKAKFVGLLTFKSEGPIHIGKEREGNVLYTLRLSDEHLLIPSSTWKGSFRALAEKLAPTLPMSDLERLAVERLMPAQRPEEAKRNVKDLLKEFLEALKGRPSNRFNPKDVREKLTSLGYEVEQELIEDKEWALVQYLCLYCPIGKLFGNWARAGSLRFFDTILTSDTQRRPGVGINRRTGTVQENVLYYVETSRARLKVPLVIVGEVDERGSTSAKLLASTLEAVEVVGLSVGGRKSVGLGLLTLEEARFHAFELGVGQDVSGIFLANPLKAPSMSLRDFTAWLRTH